MSGLLMKMHRGEKNASSLAYTEQKNSNLVEVYITLLRGAFSGLAWPGKLDRKITPYPTQNVA